MPLRFFDEAASSNAAGVGANRALMAVLAGTVALSALINGHWFTGLVGAAGIFLFGDQLLAWFLAAKTGAVADDAAETNLDAALADVLNGLEAARQEMAAEIAQRLRTRLPAGLAVGVIVWAYLQFKHHPPGLIELVTFAVAGATAGWLWASAALAELYSARYKQEVLPRLAASFGALDYRPVPDLDLAAMDRSHLFGNFDISHAEDEIFGRYHDVPISILELRLEKRHDKSTTIVFDGLLVRITLPRGLKGTTAVIVDGGLFGVLRDTLQQRSERVRLEDPAFEARYQVFGTDQIAARALLTPAFMERFMRLGERTGYGTPVALAEDNRLTIALPKAGFNDLFEPPSYTQPSASRTALARLHADIAAILLVADAVIDLDQSVRGRAPSESAQ